MKRQEARVQEARVQEAKGREARGRGARGWWGGLVVAVLVVGAAACEPGPALETRTFEVQYLPSYRVDQLIAPYVFSDRAESPGMMSATEGAVTVRETPDNLEKIARVLAEYDRPNPTIMLSFQIIEADGAAEPDPAIEAVERELRRLFRFEGYDLVAETQIVGIQGTGTRQIVRGEGPDPESFVVRTGVTEVRRGDPTTVTLDVQLALAPSATPTLGPLLETSVTVPAGHSVVLGTAQSTEFEGALILVVRAEILDAEGEEAG